MIAIASNEQSDSKLGETLKRCRLARGFTIATLSQKAGIAVGQIHKLENDHVKKVNPAHLAALSRPLDISISQLYQLAGYHPSERLELESDLTKGLRTLPPSALRRLELYIARLTAEYGLDQSKTEQDIKRYSRRGTPPGHERRKTP